MNEMLNICIGQGYVPSGCKMDGMLVWLLINEGRNPCDGCNANCVHRRCSSDCVKEKYIREELEYISKEELEHRERIKKRKELGTNSETIIYVDTDYDSALITAIEPNSERGYSVRCKGGADPEVTQHVKDFAEWLREKYKIEVDLIIDYPKDKNGKRITFKDVIEKYGYPMISKEVSRDVAVARNNPDGKTAQKFVRGSDYHKKYGDRWLLEKWAYLINAPFKISNQCCNIMKKTPAHKFNKESGMIPIIGTMACESVLRQKEWLRAGCNAFDNKEPNSKPLSFWTEQDVLKYLKDFEIPYPSVYGEILIDDKGKYYTTGCDRTGCVFCGYGCHLKSDKRFERLAQTHPTLHDYCMKPWDEGGLGMKEVLEYIENGKNLPIE